jgi:hypothetical protein
MHNYYVYAFLDSSKPGNYEYSQDLVFNHQPFYIGMGINNRINESLKYDKTNKIKTAIIERILNSNMKVIPMKIKEHLSLKDAYDYEIYSIEKIGRIILKTGPLSNIIDGGDTYRDNVRSVLQYDIKGNFIKEYRSVSEAIAETGVINISYCCSGKRNLAGKFIWRYKIDNTYSLTIPTDFLEKMTHFGNYETPVIQFDMNCNFINRYKSIKEASEITGCSSPRIVDVCKGNRTHTRKFIWKYDK